MIPELGHFSLILALCLAVIQGVCPIVGAARGLPSWMATNAAGRPRLNTVTATVQSPRIRLQSSSDPSCAPHTADTR